jgi:hypothetical protein
MSNHPFIKTNYPHHEGVWGWEDAADQVVLMVRNIRKSMNEYHDILWDIGYAKTWEEANLHLDKLYSERPPLEVRASSIQVRCCLYCCLRHAQLMIWCVVSSGLARMERFTSY